jgi:hypothetical protein
MSNASLSTHPQQLESARRVRARLHRIAYWLDGCITVPGTRWKIGLEPIIGLVPVVGDLVGLVLSGFIIIEGVRVGAPPRLTARMVGIAVIDLLSGLVPVLGDVFDFAFKANRRNAELLIRHLDTLEGRRPQPSRWRQFAYVVLGLSLVCGLAWSLYWMAQFLSG